MVLLIFLIWDKIKFYNVKGNTHEDKPTQYDYQTLMLSFFTSFSKTSWFPKLLFTAEAGRFSKTLIKPLYIHTFCLMPNSQTNRDLISTETNIEFKGE